MKFALTQKTITFALAAVAVTPLCISGEIGLFWVLALVVMGMCGWFIEPPTTRNRRFRGGVTVLVFVVLAVQIARVFSGEPMARVGMEFAVSLLGIKLCSRGYAADYQQIVILAFLHIIAATIVMNDLSYAGSFLLFVALCPPVLALSYLRREMENRFGEGPKKDGPEMLERLLRSKRVISPGFLFGSSLLSLPVLLITAVLFITFPRIGFGLFGQLTGREKTVGFGDEITLGDIDLIRQNETVLLRLEPLNFKSDPPERLPLKLRGAIFDRFAENKWTQSRKGRWSKLSPRGSFFLLEQQTFSAETTPGFDVLLESIEPPVMFIPEGTGVIGTHRVAAGGKPKVRTLERNSYGAIRYKNDAGVGIRYRAYLTGTAPYGEPPNDHDRYLQLPPESARLVALARKFAESGSPKERAHQIVRKLKWGYRYSTRISADKANALARTPLDRFLFTRKSGTCEHFGTALTLMLRAVGIPARLATGFSSADWNPLGEYYAVRQRSAHSWTEAYLEGTWTTLDATPPSAEPTQETKLTALAMLVDNLRMRWHKHIIGYDASSQFSIAMGMWRFWLRTFRAERQLREVPTWPVWVLFGVVAAVGGLVWLKRRRPRTDSKVGTRPLRRHARAATKLYRKLDHRLGRLGYPRPQSRTPDEHVRLLNSSQQPFASAAEKITKRYNEVRFGGRAFRPGELDELRGLIKGI